MTTLPNDPLLSEIDDEVRHDQIMQLVKQYAPAFTAMVFAVVVAVGGFEGWQWWQENQAIKQASAWDAAVAKAAASREEEIKVMADFADHSSGGYHVLALLRKAKAEQSLDKKDDATATYMAIYNDHKIEPEFRELGLLLGAYQAMANGKTNDVRSEVEKAVSGVDAVYPGMLREWLALADANAGDDAKAAKIFSELAEDASAPQQLQHRADAMAHVLALDSAKDKK